MDPLTKIYLSPPPSLRPDFVHEFMGSLVRFSPDIWVIDVFPSCGTMGSRFWLAATLPILVFLQIIPWVTGQNHIIPPDNPVIGIVGNGAVLPCQVQGKIIPEKLSVQWIFAGSSTEREVATFDRKKLQNQFLEFEGYRGRTEFFPQKFHQGNLSLLLKNVHPSDKGKYICIVFLENWYDEVVVDLDVAAQGAEPSIFLDGHAGNGIDLSCRSQGWFPAPSVVWLDSQGRTRPEEVTTQSTPGPSSDVFDVVSSMSLEPGSDREVSCRVVSEVLNVMRESRVQIAGLNLGIIGAVICNFIQTRKAARSRKKAEKDKECVKAELETQRETNKAAMVENRNKLGAGTCEQSSLHSVPGKMQPNLRAEHSVFSRISKLTKDGKEIKQLTKDGKKEGAIRETTPQTP